MCVYNFAVGGNVKTFGVSGVKKILYTATETAPSSFGVEIKSKRFLRVTKFFFSAKSLRGSSMVRATSVIA